MKCSDDHEIEARLVAEADTWGQHPHPDAKPITLEDLRQRAEMLSEEAQEALRLEVAAQELMEVRQHDPQPETSWLRRCFKPLAAAVAVCLLLTFFAPRVIMASVDFPGVGPLIQKAVLQYAGIRWAYDNGYIQGTVAQVSKDGVTLRILGVAADPIQTAVIYMLQGVQPPQESSAKPQPATRADDVAPQSAPGYQLFIKSIDGEGSWSGWDPPVWTQLGYVGVLQTAPLPAVQGELEVELRVPGSADGHVSLLLPVTREAVSKLAQELPIEYEKTVDGITVTGKRAVVTPALLMVEYSVQGGHAIYGETPEGMHTYLDDPLANQGGAGGYAHGTQVDGVWQNRAIFPRPQKRDDSQLFIPGLAKDIPIDLSWPLEQNSGEQNVLGVPVQISSRRGGSGEVTIELSWPLNDQFGNLSGMEISDTDGRVLDHSLRQQSEGTMEKRREVSYRYQFAPESKPASLRITTAEQNVHGQWVIPIPPIK